MIALKKRGCLFAGLVLLCAGAIVPFVPGCGPSLIEKSPDARPALTQAASVNASSAVTLKAQVNSLLADKATLEQQKAALEKALQDATATGNYIDKAKIQGAQASAAAVTIPVAVSTLAAQKNTLDQANASNADLRDQLDKSRANNKTLTDSNTKLKSDNDTLLTENETVTAKLNVAYNAVAQGEAEKAQLRDANGKLSARAEKAEGFIKKHDNDIFGAKTHRFFAHTLEVIGIALLLLGLAAAGVYFGVSNITKPVGEELGRLESLVFNGMHKGGAYVLSLFPIVGRTLEKWMTDLALYAKSGTIKSVVVPTPAPISTAPGASTGAAPCSPVVANMLRLYGVQA